MKTKKIKNVVNIKNINLNKLRKKIHLHGYDVLGDLHSDEKRYKYLFETEVNHGTCPFCGGEYVSTDKTYFKDMQTLRIIVVHTSACYGICNICGAV